MRAISQSDQHFIAVINGPVAGVALALNLVNRIVPHQSLLDEAQGWGRKVCDLPENVTAMAKAQLRKTADMSWEQAPVMEEFAAVPLLGDFVC